MWVTSQKDNHYYGISSLTIQVILVIKLAEN